MADHVDGGLRAKGLVLLAVVALLAAVGYVLFATEPERAIRAGSFVEEEVPSIRETADELEPSPIEVSALEARAREQQGSREIAAAPETPLVFVAVSRFETGKSPAGRLRLRALDSETREPIESFRVRAASRTRLADLRSDSGSGEIELRLSPDTYTLLVMSDGYEPTELGPVAIVRDQDTVPEPVLLRSGDARILGVVNGMRPDPAFRVELRGEGRRPCEKCATERDENRHCGDCGYSKSSTRIPVTPSGTFTFDHLVGGSYAILLTDAVRRPAGLPKFVQVRSGESVPVEMDAAGFRTVRVEILDTDGRSLAPEWARRNLALSKIEVDEVVEFSSLENAFPSIDFGCTFRAGDCDLASAGFSPPSEVMRWGVFATSCGIGGGFGPPSGVDDRPRDESETLRPAPSAPEIDPTRLDSGVDAEGLAVFEGVSSLALTLELSSGPFLATVSLPASAAPTRVQARLTRDRGSPESDEPARTFLEFEASRSR